MAQDGDTRSSNEPKHGGEGRSQEAEGHGDAEQGGVELRGGSAPAPDLEVVALQFADTVHATNDEEDEEEQLQVGEQAVDAEHDEDDGIVAGEVAQVVVEPALHGAEVFRLGDALDVEELGDGPQVGKTGGNGLAPQAIEAAREVHPGG